MSLSALPVLTNMTSPLACESTVCLVGAFPPPVHGMAVVNAAVLQHLKLRGIATIALNLSPASISRTWSNRLARVQKVGSALFAYLRQRRRGGTGTLYVGLSAGWGQLYEALFVAIARIRGTRIFLHHHSFMYLEQPNALMQFLVKLAGPGASHIVLGEGQRQRLRECYPAVFRTIVVSNAAITQGSIVKNRRNRSRVKRIGFLGNISQEKGVIELLAIADRLERESVDFDICMAGPFETSSAESVVRQAVERLRSATYLGPVYGAAKEDFWNSVDVLLFPSKNEAAPLVVYEAMAHGVVVIAWERGCLSEMLPANAGLLVRRDQDFVSVAVQQLLAWQRHPESFSEMSQTAANHFAAQHARSKQSLEELLDDMCQVTADSAMPAVALTYR